MTASKEPVVSMPVITFVDRETRHLTEKVDLQFRAQKEALALAMIRLNERLAEMNELRTQIASERGSYLMRERFDVEHETLSKRVSAIELLLSNYQGRMTIVVALWGLLILAINHFWR